MQKVRKRGEGEEHFYVMSFSLTVFSLSVKVYWGPEVWEAERGVGGDWHKVFFVSSAKKWCCFEGSWRRNCDRLEVGPREWSHGGACVCKFEENCIKVKQTGVRGTEIFTRRHTHGQCKDKLVIWLMRQTAKSPLARLFESSQKMQGESQGEHTPLWLNKSSKWKPASRDSWWSQCFHTKPHNLTRTSQTKSQPATVGFKRPPQRTVCFHHLSNTKRRC